MNNDFPKMLYKHGGNLETNDGRYSYVIVADPDEQEEKVSEGYFLSMAEAKEAVKEKPKAPENDNAPPTRDELETKAKDLNVKFDGRTSDKKLLDQINEALKSKE